MKNLMLCAGVSLAISGSAFAMSPDQSVATEEYFQNIGKSVIVNECVGYTEGGTYGSKYYVPKKITLKYCELDNSGTRGSEGEGSDNRLFPCDTDLGAYASVNILDNSETRSRGEELGFANFFSDSILKDSFLGEGGTEVTLADEARQRVELDLKGESEPASAGPNRLRVERIINEDPSEKSEMNNFTCEVENHFIIAEPNEEVLSGALQTVGGESDIWFLNDENYGEVTLNENDNLEIYEIIRANLGKSVEVKGYVYSVSNELRMIVNGIEVIEVAAAVEEPVTEETSSEAPVVDTNQAGAR